MNFRINKFYFILFLWLLLTLININKAFHIDDTFHIKAAEYLKEHPGKPMSGYINWGDNPTTFSEHNQPPFFFYLISLYSFVFGKSEISLHLFLSLFTFVTLLLFIKICEILKIDNKLYLLTLFSFCPALIVNQNIMTDVPVLTLLLASVYFLIKSQKENKNRNYLMSILSATAGLLIKYSILPVFAVIGLSMIFNRDKKKLVFFLIPILIMAAWSFWNFSEYNGIHFLDRPKEKPQLSKVIAFINCLGAISAFGYVLLNKKPLFRFFRLALLILFILLILLMLLFYFGVTGQSLVQSFLNYIFISNGLIIILTGLTSFLHSKTTFRALIKTDQFILVLTVLFFSLFIILFSPFMATRHVLLIIPFILILAGNKISQHGKRVLGITLLITVAIGILLGISDWKYADFYRKMAVTSNKFKDHTVWTAGHWGWQWYSEKAGMLQYNTNESAVNDGDYFIYPGNISRQKFNSDIRLVVREKLWIAPDQYTFFSVSNFASMYNSYHHKPAWTFSKDPIDTIYICKVQKGIQAVISSIKDNPAWFNDVKLKAIKNNIPVDSMLTLDAQWIIDNKK
jgi:4-amino-4-deoxy-L-arabinose transferase-like glycosyltransferase